ncbi:hypothetical protein BATDEDRAFT_11481 [Batrachochytrium dendrobatidis JAM81]|uniref:Galactose-1-phosphate uridylyltransferase n=1 Tax=Batrachochytrium dendrobatidis (strain JAM81 / FGSC 10211) TaxID=684364 RepID=F4P3Y2_BATDJ|nr:UDP-glucose:hexose-1-phosphate uridylyltransferase [Batrachochytrium dendrobatidis JAM81]EGF80553.1 hypothetical protein BATDEDRAFT_11481 [Batrachochytrium dendrobatidis JAM81]|eukprot:XP_006678859.1 hypothetical protein BATDEDRAFT_11481 [Batrachochytrium dendrobatidis JAM81]
MSGSHTDDVDYSDCSHRRFNPLNGSWVLCSPHRAKRPWLGHIETQSTLDIPSYQPDCNLCPNNRRVNGQVNPDYSAIMVFDNDFPAIQREAQELNYTMSTDLFQIQPVAGYARVLCFSPNHNLTLAEMDVESIGVVIDAWVMETDRMVQTGHVKHVQIFENKGDTMGCSNPHPHCQASHSFHSTFIWGTDYIPNEPSKELACMKAYQIKHASCLLCDYIHSEIASCPTLGSRVVFQTDYFVCLVPFWAVWPFETLIVATHHVGQLSDLDQHVRADLAKMIKALTCKYDNLFQVSFPYSMGVHQSPFGEADCTMHLHLHFYPPLLRSASVRKFLVGFEMLAEAQRDLTPETAAAKLRDCPTQHYQSKITMSNTSLE